MRTIRVRRTCYKNGQDETEEIIFRGDEISYIETKDVVLAVIKNQGEIVSLIKSWDSMEFADSVIE